MKELVTMDFIILPKSISFLDNSPFSGWGELHFNLKWQGCVHTVPILSLISEYYSKTTNYTNPHEKKYTYLMFKKHWVIIVPDNGDKVSLVGCSAGGSAVFNAFFERRDTVHKVINVCGRLRSGNQRGILNL